MQVSHRYDRKLAELRSGQRLERAYWPPREEGHLAVRRRKRVDRPNRRPRARCGRSTRSCSASHDWEHLEIPLAHLLQIIDRAASQPRKLRVRRRELRKRPYCRRPRLQGLPEGGGHTRACSFRPHSFLILLIFFFCLPARPACVYNKLCLEFLITNTVRSSRQIRNYIFGSGPGFDGEGKYGCRTTPRTSPSVQSATRTDFER